MTINRTLFSSASQEWETPLDLYTQLNEEFHFQFDLAASATNTKCGMSYYSFLDNSLIQEWHKIEGYLWLNPPYGRQVGLWVKKAYEESRNGAKIVMLLPARTDTKWFHEYIYRESQIRFLRGRLKFGGSKNSAPFPSMVVIFR